MNNWPHGGYYDNAGYPQNNFPSIPSHITHSWSNMGMPGDPIAGLVAAMNRLAAALEKFNEREAK